MKSKILQTIIAAALISVFNSCNLQAPIMNTQNVKILNSFIFPMPEGFQMENDSTYVFMNEKKISKIFFTKTNDNRSLDTLLYEFPNQILGDELSNSELVKSDTLISSDKSGILNCYKKNENPGGYEVNSYFSVGIIKFKDVTLKMRTLSLGLNINPTLQNSFFSTKTIK